MTRAEILDCLTDRPCDSCKFHESGRCERWNCVFEERPDEPKQKERTRMENDKSVKYRYKSVALQLLKLYLESEQAVISEFSGDFEKSALALKEKALGCLKKLDEGEDIFNDLVKDMWISVYYEKESED